MELVRVPGTDNVHVVAIIVLVQKGPVGRDDIEHRRHPDALAYRTALMRTEIAIGVIFAAMPDDADLDRAGRDDPHAPFNDLAILANQHFSHLMTLPSLFKLVDWGRSYAPDPHFAHTYPAAIYCIGPMS